VQLIAPSETTKQVDIIESDKTGIIFLGYVTRVPLKLVALFIIAQ